MALRPRIEMLFHCYLFSKPTGTAGDLEHSSSRQKQGAFPKASPGFACC
jgi:hypothetical protein